MPQRAPMVALSFSLWQHFEVKRSAMDCSGHINSYFARATVQRLVKQSGSASMPKDYLNQPISEVRRSDRAVNDDAWIRKFLHHAAIGTLATVHDGQPFVNTNLYVYDEARHCIYLHTARLGRTRSNVDSHERVSFTIMEMGRLLPADEALEFSVEYAGVVVFGNSYIVEEEGEATEALQMLLDKYAPHLAAGEDYAPPMPEELKRTAVFRVDITDWSGKKKEIDGFSGAYWYPDQPILRSVRQRTVWNGVLNAIFIAPESHAPVVSLSEVEAIAGKGLQGDRYFGDSGSFGENEEAGREVTLIAQEDIEAIGSAISSPLQADQMRRNLVTCGVPLNYLVGKRFRVGSVVLEGKGLCEPCDGLAKSTGYGPTLIRAALHRAGLRAEIIQGGTISVGEPIVPLDEPEA
jgi:hypothetical protein